MILMQSYPAQNSPLHPLISLSNLVDEILTNSASRLSWDKWDTLLQKS